MAVVIVSRESRRAFRDAYAEWARSLGSRVDVDPRESPERDGRLSFPVSQGFLKVLREKKIPYELKT